MMNKLSGVNSDKILEIALNEAKEFVKKISNFVKILELMVLK